MALLGNVPRNATIRTVTRVQALKMARGSFAALYTSLPGFNEQFNRVMEARLKELRTR
jgi:CRP-like cAMP-binding protein